MRAGPYVRFYSGENIAAGRGEAFDRIYLEEAAGLIGGDRRRDYGTASENFDRIARYWNQWLEKKLRAPLDARDVGILMVLLKLAREMNTPKRDNLVDAVGYLGCLGQIDDEARAILSTLKTASGA